MEILELGEPEEEWKASMKRLDPHWLHPEPAQYLILEWFSHADRKSPVVEQSIIRYET